jgi:DNA-directed RNA polymerase subunit RPC12/RpoP
MPKYIYKCNKCNKEIERITPSTWQSINCKCGGAMVKQLPILKKTVTRETVDKDRNVSWIDNQEKIMNDRSREHFWKHEVKKLVQSGQYSVKTMIENGWVYIDKNGIMRINDTPPNKEKDIKISGKK